MKKRLKIALVLPEFEPWGMARFLNGVTDYARERNWLLTHCPVDPDSSRDCPLDWSSLKSWQVDGIIIRIIESSRVRQLGQLHIPMVNMAGDAEINSKIPAVAPNSRMIGRLAAEHLISLGLKNLAYYGVQGCCYSDLRWEGFREAAREAGLKVVRFCVPHTTRDALWNERHEPLRKWLRTLPLPVGLFAVHDYGGLTVLSACRDIELSVPDDVAVIGADNNLMVCEFSVPTLSSVCINAYRMGQEAAKLLDHIMRGEAPPREPVLVDPPEVVARGSTDVLHMDDPAVKKAVQFMQKHFVESFKMDTVAEAGCVSRRSLETRFRATLQTSPAEFLAKLRVKKAVAILNSQTAGTNEEIARQCGLVNGDNLRAAFRRILNASPGDFRASKKQ